MIIVAFDGLEYGESYRIINVYVSKQYIMYITLCVYNMCVYNMCVYTLTANPFLVVQFIVPFSFQRFIILPSGWKLSHRTC